MDALEMHRNLAGRYLDAGRIFMLHFAQLNPEILIPEVAKPLLACLTKAKIDPNDFPVSVESLAQLRQHGTIEGAVTHLKNGAYVQK